MSIIPLPRWQELSSQASYYHRSGLSWRGIDPMNEAIELLRQETGLTNQLAVKLNYLANMFLATGRLTEAEGAVREAIQIETGCGKSASDSNLMTLAKILHQQGRCADAVRVGKQALALRRKYLDWRSDYYRQSKKLVASFKKPPVVKTETENVFGQTA
jgi:tetratricopeptide (TPR) repeat protein